MDIVALRAEIKAWERDFKTDNGRDATIQDIKERPDLGVALSIGTMDGADNHYIPQLRSTGCTKS